MFQLVEQAVVVAVEVAEMRVVEAGRVFEQVHGAHRVGRLPRVGQRQLGREFAHRRVEVEPPLFDPLHRRDRDEHLADGTDAKARVRVGLARAGRAGDAVGEQHLVAAQQHEAGAGDVRVGQDLRGTLAHGLDARGNRAPCRGAEPEQQ